MSTQTFAVYIALLLVYTFSIVFGRLYSAMHSFTDITLGSALGALIWGLYHVGWPYVEHWLQTAGWQVPVVLIPLTALLVNRHPQPVDDCPCFEDAISFIAVSLS